MLRCSLQRKLDSVLFLSFHSLWSVFTSASPCYYWCLSTTKWLNDNDLGFYPRWQIFVALGILQCPDGVHFLYTHTPSHAFTSTHTYTLHTHRGPWFQEVQKGWLLAIRKGASLKPVGVSGGEWILLLCLALTKRTESLQETFWSWEEVGSLKHATPYTPWHPVSLASVRHRKLYPTELNRNVMGRRGVGHWVGNAGKSFLK